MNRKVVVVVSLLAGLMDMASGMLMVVAPELALRLMGVHTPYADWIFIRFIGTFVFAVGSSYLAALCWATLAGGWGGLRFLWAFTAWVRFCVFVFTASAILSGGLSAAWFSVPVTDGVLALFQVWWIFSRRFRLDHV